MPYQTSIQEHEGYLRVKLWGERTPGNEEDDAVQVWSQVAGVCREKQVNRILAISNVTGRLPAREGHAIAYNPARFGWSKQFKLALVDTNEESRQDIFFVEDVAVSSGYKFRVFDNEQEAKTWLLEN